MSPHGTCEAEDKPPPRTPTVFEDKGWILHLFTLSGLAVAQPLLDLLSRNAEFFVVRRAGGGEILALVFALLVLVPLPLVALVAVAKGIGRRLPRPLGKQLGDLTLGAVLAGLGTLLVLLILTRSRLLDGRLWLAAGLATGLGFAWLYRRSKVARLLLTYLGVALVAIPAVFFFHPRISKIVFPRAGSELRTSGARSPIVFLLFDELSLTALLDADRRIDRRSYPHLAAFADDATFFTNATTVSDVTELAVPAILAGVFPEKGRLPVLQDYPRNLFTIFGDYRIWASEAITRLCPPAENTAEERIESRRARLRSFASDLWVVYRHLLLPPRYASHLAAISDRWQGFGRNAASPVGTDRQNEPSTLAGNFTQAAIEALAHDRRQDLRRLTDALDPDVDAALYFLHVLLPHAPWEYLPSGKVYTARKDRIPGLAKEIWQDDDAFTIQAYRRYLLQTGFLDRWFGDLVDRLRQLDLYDRALIVFVADHGVSFRPGDSRRLLTATNAHDLLSIPLFIKAPFQRHGQVVERPVTTLDILPSILDLLDVEPPGPLAGRSAFAAAAPPGNRRVVGKYRSMDLDSGFDALADATLDWKLATFGAGVDAADFWRAGTHPDLYGRRTEDLGWRQQDTVTLRLEGETSFQHYDAGDGYTPAFVSGLLAAPPSDAECCDLAVAVNGVVRSTVRTHGATPDELEFSALVPDEAFRDGDNRIDVFRVRSAGPRPVLEHLGPARGSWSLSTDGEGRALALEQDGRRLPIEAGALAGYVESVTLGSRVTASGWAADRAAAAAAEQILAFCEGKLVASGFATQLRPDVNASLGLDASTRTAFQLDIPRAVVPDLGRSGLRLFARSKSAASELGFFYGLETGADGTPSMIRLTNGREIPVVAGALAGSLDQVTRDGNLLILKGWAADLKHHQPAQSILTFSGGKRLRHSHDFLERPDVALDRSMPEILQSGFEQKIDLPAAEATPELVVVAVSRHGKATVLREP